MTNKLTFFWLAIVTENELGLAFPPRNLPKEFRPDPSTFYLVIVVTNRQTNRQTNAGDYIIPRESFRGDNNLTADCNLGRTVGVRDGLSDVAESVAVDRGRAGVGHSCLVVATHRRYRRRPTLQRSCARTTTPNNCRGQWRRQGEEGSFPLWANVRKLCKCVCFHFHGTSSYYTTNTSQGRRAKSHVDTQKIQPGLGDLVL